MITTVNTSLSTKKTTIESIGKLVKSGKFSSRNSFINEAILEKLERVEKKNQLSTKESEAKK